MMDRQVSSSFTEIDLETVAPILEGKLGSLPPISSRLVRVFVSSTFSDMVEERNVLMEYLYPKLKHYCRDKYGLEFQLIDLRWGIRDEAQDDHTTIDFCVREIENCKKSSIGPSFVALLGQKYGYRPFPPNIKADEFEAIRIVLIQDGRDITLLNTWYRRDENSVPPYYNLQPISSILKHYNDPDPELRERDRSTWTCIFEELRLLLRHGIILCVNQGLCSMEDRDKYFVSVTEYEIAKGMPDMEDCKRHCVCIVRDIRYLENYLHLPPVTKFLDIDPLNPYLVDRESQHLLRQLREEKIPKMFSGSENLSRIELEWLDPSEGNPNARPGYLDRFCQILYEKLSTLITNAMWAIENLVSDSFVVEVIQHLSMCKMRCQIFRGREETICRIKRYVTGEPRQPLVIYGESGCGKTSVVAKTASMAHMWFPDKKPMVILRFLGTSARSASIRLVLGSVCWQIAVMFGLDVLEIPSDYPSLVTYFHDILKIATEERPLVILLDSLDQLSTSHRAHNLVWLPQRLPPHVSFIVSTLPYEHDLLQTLKGMIVSPKNYIQILPLGQSFSMHIIQEWLAAEGRTLVDHQMVLVEHALQKCSLPLYMRLVFKEVCRWPSYMKPEDTVLEATVKGVIKTLFDRVERQHGKTFVCYALSYITASKNGLSDAELEDVMSLDDIVLNDVFIHWIPPIRRIPPLLWPRLYNDLSNYIVQREANGIIVNWWYHRQFISVARERYLHDPKHCRYIHSILSDYFLGTWGGRPKPFEYTEKHVKDLQLSSPYSETDRKVPKQPMWFGQSMYMPLPRLGRVLYNLRKLSEMPYHLIESRRVHDLNSEVLFNYTWLHTKLSATSLQDLLSDFVPAIEAGIDDKEVQVLLNSLRVGGSYVNQNPDTLGFDLIGRLLPFYDRYSNIRSLLQQCDSLSRKHSALVPVFQCYESPSEVLLYILEDHTKLVLWLAFCQSSNELISVSRDGTIAFWDISRGERMRMMDISNLCPSHRTKILQSRNGQFLVCDTDKIGSPVHIFDLKSGQLLHRFGAQTGTQNRLFVVNNLLVRQKSIIDMRTGEVIRSLDDFTSSKQYVTVGITNNEEMILIGENSFSNLFDLHSGKLLATFPGDNIPSTFLMSADDTRVYVGYAVDCLFKVYDICPASDLFGKIILEYSYLEELPEVCFLEGPHYGRELSEISICKADTHLVLLNIRRSNLVVLNMSTRESYVMDVESIDATDDTFLFGTTFSFDGQFVIAGETSYLHVWRAFDGSHLSSIMIHSVYKFPFSVSNQANLVATGSNIHTAIKIWDLDKLHGREDKQLRIYENPIDMVAVAKDVRCLYVKQYYPLGSGRGYKYLHHFGIDVWNLSTGSSANYLPFNQYGQLLQMDVTLDGQQMVLLLSNRDDTYLCIINNLANEVRQLISHAQCHGFVLSHNGEHIATSGGSPGIDHEVKLWKISDGSHLVTIAEATNAMFLLDNSAMVTICDADSIFIYTFENQSLQRIYMGDVDQLQLLPCHPSLLILSMLPTNDEDFAVVKIFDIIEKKVVLEMGTVAPTGFLDISKDGRVGIDGYLQVFDMQTGITSFKIVEDYHPDSVPDKPELSSFVSLTYDGKYAIWVNQLSVKVCRLSDGKMIANTSTHEKVSCLKTLDFGYLIMIGREDGHVVTMKLLDPDVIPEIQTYSSKILSSRRSCNSMLDGDLSSGCLTRGSSRRSCNSVFDGEVSSGCMTRDSSFETAYSESSLGSLEMDYGEYGEKFCSIDFDGYIVANQLRTGVKDRSQAILDFMPVTEEIIGTFDPTVQRRPRILIDGEVPCASSAIQAQLSQRAHIPHAVINTNRRLTLTGDHECSSSNSSPMSSPCRLRASSDAETFFGLGIRRGSFGDMLSPSKFLRSTSGLILTLTGSSENLTRKES